MVDAVRRRLVCDICQAEIPTLLLAGNQTLPSVTALSDDFFSVLLVLALSAEGKLVFGLSVWDFIDTEPLVGGSEKAGEVAFNILNVVELGRERIIDLKKQNVSESHSSEKGDKTNIDDNDLPVGLFLIQKSHDAENFDLLDLTSVANKFANLANIKRIVVALGFSLGVYDIGIFPGLDWLLVIDDS